MVYDRGMETVLCLNGTKALMRSVVCKAYSVWAKTLIKVTPTRKGISSFAEDATVYTLPATLWELEQQAAIESSFALRLGLKHKVSLHSFELDRQTYLQQNDTRSFMLDNIGLYPNFDFAYYNDEIHPNRHTKRNFFAWFDYCGLPTRQNLDVALDRQNFVTNSVVFVTFCCKWRRADSIPDEIKEAVNEHMGSRVDAVVDYLNKHTGNRVKVFASLEYQAQGNSPMMMIGLSNCPDILEKPSFHQRIDRNAPSIGVGRDYRPLTAGEKGELERDLRSFSFTQEELSEKYDCSARQVGSGLAWVRRYGLKGGYA